MSGRCRLRGFFVRCQRNESVYRGFTRIPIHGESFEHYRQSNPTTLHSFFSVLVPSCVCLVLQQPKLARFSGYRDRGTRAPAAIVLADAGITLMRGSTMISTLRFCPRPSAVSLAATG